ncbi:quinon protein alcohol dehydrogenase-like superfamily [Mycena crocata]|nr:quinon protein alcohol dehydrogenase-like superfamily [Mycena crocata]
MATSPAKPTSATRSVLSSDFFKTWKHSLQDDFQQNGVPAETGSWLCEETRIQVGKSEAKVAALSRDNSLVAAVVGQEIQVYDVATSQRLHTFRGHAGRISQLEFHPGGRKLTSGSSIYGAHREELVRVWDLGAPQQSLDFHAQAVKDAVAAASPTLLRHWSAEDLESANLETEIAKIISSAQVAVDVRNGRAFVGCLCSFESRAFSHDGTSLLYRPNRSTVAVLDVAKLTERFRLSGHTDSIVWAETSPNDKVVATSSWDRTVRIWSMESGETIRVLEGAMNQSWSGAFSDDGDLIAAGAGDSTVRIWRVETGELLHTLNGFQRQWVRSLSFSPDGLHLAAGSGAGNLRVFNLESGECEQNWQIDLSDDCVRSFLEISRVKFTARGDLFFRSTEGRIFGYRASRNVKWEYFGTQFGTVITSADGSKLFAFLGDSINIWNIEAPA